MAIHQCRMAASCTHHLPPPNCSTRPIQKSLFLYKKYWIFWGVSKKITRQKELKDQVEEEDMDRKGKSNESPNIADRRTTSRIPSLSLGLHWWRKNCITVLHRKSRHGSELQWWRRNCVTVVKRKTDLPQTLNFIGGEGIA